MLNINPQPIDSGEWQSNLDSVSSTEEKNDSFLLLELFDAFVFSSLGGGKASSVAVVYKAELEGHKGVIKLVEKLVTISLELLAVILMDNSQFYFTRLCGICPATLSLI